MNNEITVEVIYAGRHAQKLVTVSLGKGATAADAIERSGILADFPEINRDNLPIGIWGRVVDRQQRVNEGDRVEIYRRLDIDPREARRQLAQAGLTMSEMTDAEAD